MQSKAKIILSFIFVCVLGVLLHFTYDWSGKNPIIGLFSSKNESTWEHLKLIFFPMLILTINQVIHNRSFIKERLAARTVATVAGMAFIVVVFYTFWGISGVLIDFINISIYFLGVLFAFWVEEKAPEKNISLDASTCFFIWATFIILFVAFSIKAPNLGIFFDLQTHPKMLPIPSTFPEHL